MNKFKTVLAFILVAALFCTIAISASAETADLTGHQYKAFQIFSGSQNEDDTTGALGSVKWGDGIRYADFLTAIKSSEAFGDPNPFIHDDTAAEVARHLEDFENDSDALIAFSKLAYEYRVLNAGIDCQDGDTTLPAGYYLVVDVTSFGQNETNTVYNMALLQQTRNGRFEIRNKASVPVLIKKVKDINDSEASDSSEWLDSADWDIGDNVVFRVTVTLGEMKNYDNYAITIHDTLSNAFTYNRNSAVIKIGNTLVTEKFDISATNTAIAASCSNVKEFASDGDVITLEYTAKLGTNAKIGAEGNDNVAYLEYSNNPNDSSSRGRTPDDLVRVFTYQLTVNKVDEEGNPLTGASFELLKKNASGTYSSKGVIRGTTSTVFTWVGLDDGDYRIVETVAPDGCNPIEPIEFSIAATHEDPSADPQLLTLTGADNFTVTLSRGELITDIVNEGGVILPETGSEGTQMLYTLGAILLLGGLVLIVTKKRMGETA